MGESKTITPELKAQCIQEALDCRNAAAAERVYRQFRGKRMGTGS
ncbi:MAG: hypothetical protein OWQ57_10100 [Sulfobacillus sp.]|nr:hypothetical protein [Sulfobacillus sp.]